jgi:glycosyltransferase involved in cell wall biosynthesis
MRIFFVPIDQPGNPKADPRLGSVIDMLSADNQILGLERLPHFGTSRGLLRYFRLVLYALHAIAYGLRIRKKIDAIIGMQESFGLIAATLAFVIRKPFIWDAHGNVMANYRSFKKPPPYLWIVPFLERIIGRVAHTIVVPSRVDIDLYREQGYKYTEKMVVIPSGVDLSHVDEVSGDKLSLRKKIGLDATARVIMFAGKREYPLNQEAADWINEQLAPRIAERFDDVRILIIGSGDIPSEVSPIVTYTGYVPDVYEYILASDLCLVPYKLDSGISTKLIDCMACGRPVVAMASVARLTPELVDGENIITAADRANFVDRTIDALLNLEEAEVVGTHARKVIEQHYERTAIARRWKQLLERSAA